MTKSTINHAPAARFAMSVLLILSCCPGALGAASAQATSEPQAKADSAKAEKPSPRPPDRTGKKRRGKASYYSRKFAGRTMANGVPMNPNSNAAASKTLPLGTKAKVTNLNNRKSAVVEIEDRGPYVKGRIVDLTPKTAKQLGVDETGVAPVEVAPLEVPQPDGTVKPGDAAADGERRQRMP